MIADSGNRREFESGAVRDMPAGKGRPTLVPMNVMARWFCDTMFCNFGSLIRLLKSNDWKNAVDNIDRTAEAFYKKAYIDKADMIVELSVHFEEGANKYGDNNWQKGIPWDSYIDSAIRHYVKWLNGRDDEDHARAFLWNLAALEWSILEGMYYDR